MTTHHSPPDVHAPRPRTHVPGPTAALATHVFPPTLAPASHPTLRYTLAGSPNGEPAEGGSAACD